MGRYSYLSALIAASLLHFSAAGTVACGNWDSNFGATFDIGALQRRGEEMAYMVTDGDIPCTPEVEQNFTYLFNICGSVSGTIPPTCTGEARSAAALQLDTKNTPDNPDDDWCKVAGRFDDKSMLELLNPNDPSKGLKMTYYGDKCNNEDAGRPQRKFMIEMPCDSRLTPVPVHAYEYKYCQYTVSMPSIYGCPLECPLANREVCAGNGHCAYDTDHRRARCFCSHGYTGSDCSKKESDEELNYSPALLGLIITLFVISILLVGLILFMFRQVNAYRQDASNYMALHGGDTDTGV